MDTLVASLSHPGVGTLLWGAYTRLLGLVYAIALLSFVPQLVPLAGRRGITPAHSVLAAAWRDFGVRALYWWPTVFWVSSSDLALTAVPLVGGGCGLAVFLLGGAWSPALLRICWAALLSIDSGANTLIYPWDSLLLEAGFLAPFFPAAGGTDWVRTLLDPAAPSLLSPSAWTHVTAAAAPVPLLQFAHRWLLFRVLVGFGKLKFVGSGWQDRLYIKSFLLTQPMVSPIGWWAHKTLPDAAWVASLAVMGVVELVLPCALLTSWASARVVACLGIVSLMVGIQATGNFGYFNALTAVIALPCLFVGHGTSLSFALSDAFPPEALVRGAHGAALLVAWAHGQWASAAAAASALCAAYPSHAAVLVLSVGLFAPAGGLQFIMNSWINVGWPYWPGVARVRAAGLLTEWLIVAPARNYTSFLRAIAQFRLVQAYGVFPPQVSPPQRWACVYETSEDGSTWTRLVYKHYLSSPYTAPSFIAPFHPRCDHAIFYEALGMNGASLMSGLGHYSYLAFPSATTAWSRLQALLLQGSADVSYFFRNPPATPPRYVRMLACHYRALQTPIVDRVTRQTRYYSEEVMDLHLPPMTASDCPDEDGVISPTVPSAWYDTWPENAHWLRRAVAAGNTLPDLDSAYACVQPFVAAVRASVYDTAGVVPPRGQGAADTLEPVQPPPLSPAASVRKRRDSAGPAPSTQSGPASGPHAPVTRAILCSADAARESFVSIPPSPQSLAAPLGRFTWDVLPAALTAVVASYGGSRYSDVLPALLACREATNRACFPLMWACDVLFGRPPPPLHALFRELEEVGETRHSGAEVDEASWASLYLTLPVMVEGVPLDVAAGHPRERGLPATTPDGRPIHHFAGNDDAGITGAMRNPLRWMMYAHSILLRSPAELRAVNARLSALVGVPPHDPAFLTNLRRAPKVALFRAILPVDGNGRVAYHPGRVCTEAGLFLTFLLHAPVVRCHAVSNHRLMAQSPPVRDRQTPGSLPFFLPAFLPLIPRLCAYPCLLSLGRVGEGRAIPRVPRWGFDAPAGIWRAVE